MDMRNRAKELKQSCQAAISMAEGEGRIMTEDEQNSYDVKFSELEGVLSQIKRADKLAEIAGNLSEPATAPVGPEASSAPEQTRDSHAEVRMGQDRQNERGFGSIGEQLQAIAHASHPESRYESVDKRLHFLQERGGNPENEKRASGASEAVASEGGFLVEKQFNDQILEKVYSTGEIASRVTRQAIGPTANGLTYNMVDESSRADGSRFGGLRAYWVAEAAAFTASQPTFAQQTLTLNKLACLFYSTQELLQDQTSLSGLVERAVPQEIAFQVESAIIRGTGSGQPLGILNSPATVSQAKKSGQAATTIVTDNVENMWSRMYAPNRSTMIWLVNQDAEPQLSNMADANGNALYMPPLGLSDTPFSRLYNRPVIATEHNSTLGTVGDIMAVDLSSYLLIDKGAVVGDSSMHVRFLYDEMAFRWTYRCDGQSMWNSALTPKNGTATQSPFITLATRS